MAELELTAGTIEYEQRPEHGRRFAALLPDARLVEISDSYTLIMRDQPEAFAAAIREFVADTAGARAPAWPPSGASVRP
jgi:hypothetical protein